jgi:hypothetical protein
MAVSDELRKQIGVVETTLRQTDATNACHAIVGALKKVADTLDRVGRSYKATRREEGKPDVVTHFPATASPVDAVRWCEADGYKVIGYEIIEMPKDEGYGGTEMQDVFPAR